MTMRGTGRPTTESDGNVVTGARRVSCNESLPDTRRPGQVFDYPWEHFARATGLLASDPAIRGTNASSPRFRSAA